MISSVVASDTTQLQQIVTVHGYLVLSCSYNTSVETNSAPYDTYMTYGALVKQKAVCQEYVVAFQPLMQKFGTPGIVVQGMAMNHVWDMVWHNDEWYHTDATWNDPVPDHVGVV